MPARYGGQLCQSHTLASMDLYMWYQWHLAKDQPGPVDAFGPDGPYGLLPIAEDIDKRRDDFRKRHEIVVRLWPECPFQCRGDEIVHVGEASKRRGKARAGAKRATSAQIIKPIPRRSSAAKATKSSRAKPKPKKQTKARAKPAKKKAATRAKPKAGKKKRSVRSRIWQPSVERKSVAERQISRVVRPRRRTMRRLNTFADLDRAYEDLRKEREELIHEAWGGYDPNRR